MDYRVAAESRLNTLSDDELEKIVHQDDHRYEPSDDEDIDGDTPHWPDDYIHIYWNCETCGAEALLRYRETVELSKQPGVAPLFPKGGISHHIKARDLKVHAIARYNDQPGTQGKVAAECLTVEKTGQTVTATWRKTNTNEPTFTVTYDENTSLDVFDPNPKHWE